MSAWGDSWGSSWAGAWGPVTPPPPTVIQDAWGSAWAESWDDAWGHQGTPPPPPPTAASEDTSLTSSEGKRGGYLIPPQWLPDSVKNSHEYLAPSRAYEGVSYQQSAGYLPPVEVPNLAQLKKNDPVRKKRRKLEDDLMTLD